MKADERRWAENFRIAVDDRKIDIIPIEMITLRPISPAIVEAFKSTRLRALLDTPSAFGSTHAKEVLLTDDDWRRRAVEWNGERSAAFLAFEGESPCGIVAGFLDKDDAAKAHVISMWVAPSHRNRGVGRQLVQAIFDWAKSMNVAELYLMVTSSNDSARQFYERLGFEPTGQSQPHKNDLALLEFEMRCNIASR